MNVTDRYIPITNQSIYVRADGETLRLRHGVTTENTAIMRHHRYEETAQMRITVPSDRMR
jgi:hypothetical protein